MQTFANQPPVQILRHGARPMTDRPPGPSSRGGGHGRAGAIPGVPIICPWDYELEGAAISPSSERRVSMACLGRHGRWGNTLMGYFFLQAFAHVHQMIPEVPRWVGQDLFGRRDDSIGHAYPVILYDMVSEICQEAHHPMVTFSLAAARARVARERYGRRLFVLRNPLLTHPPHPLPAASVDLEGPYLLHTRHLAQHRNLLRRLVQPIPALREPLEAAWRNLRSRGDAVIGLHLRRDDFDRAFSQQGFEFIPPMQSYLRWLERVWARHERPVLFVASDSLERVLPALARYRPVTSRDLGIHFPPNMLHPDLPPAHVERDASFFPDWFMLSRCDSVAISNSSFSFTACMINETASVFVRPRFRHKDLVPFDPWDSEPLLFLPETRNVLFDILQRLSLVQQGLGIRATLPHLRGALRWYRTLLRLRLMACRQFLSPGGLRRELLRPAFYLARSRRYEGASPGVAGPELETLGSPSRA
jgi:hypothetical protein